jgi:hypothetical protein
MVKKRNTHRILVGKPEGRKLLGRPRRRWVDNIEMELKDIGWSGMNYIDLIQDRDQWRALVNIELSGSIKLWENLQSLHNWRLLEKGSAQWSSCYESNSYVVHFT